jgi:dipeptidyl aminopeptidase/acylaminoacyl peptidase
MQQDVRETDLYREAESLYRALRRPGTGLISDATDISTDGTRAVFAGTLVEDLNGNPSTRICSTVLATGDTRVLTFGPHIDRLPKFSPDGRHIAFLSDRHKAGNFQLYLLEPATGAARSAATVEGWVEYLHWSPDGKHILLGVAGHGADVSGGQGAVTSGQISESRPPWMPSVESGDESYRWRRIWIYELATDRVYLGSGPESNIWEAVWCGNDSMAAVESSGPEEGLWYSARLIVVAINKPSPREVYSPHNAQQLGWPSASPSGARLAVVEAICSDRWLVAGEVRVIDIASGNIQTVDTGGADITHTEWRSDTQLLLAGHRGFETIVGVYDAASRFFTEIWASRDITTGGRYISLSGINGTADFVLIGENFVRAPEIAVVRGGKYCAVKSFSLGYAEYVTALAAVECVSWTAADGLEIQGWLLRPRVGGPHPLVMEVHGGPVWHWRPRWLGRGALHTLMLIKRGYAVFYPNPRGSAGRGQEFARKVVGDMGGADTYDYLSGLDHLVKQGIADPKRLGVTGVSYGGFMTAWLITQDSRFAAAVAVAPVANQVTEHLISNIPHFVSLFLADKYTNPGGKYFQRSPIMHADRVRTPTLNICGALDRCTPPEEAIQFHNALLEHGIKSVLVTYPQEGHGIRGLPAAIDYAARVVAWFDAHMSPDSQPTITK